MTGQADSDASLVSKPLKGPGACLGGKNATAKETGAPPRIRSSKADAAWRECLDRNLFGADTPDYCLQADRGAQSH